MAVYFAYGSLETYLPLYLLSKGIPVYEIGLIFSIQVLSIALSQPIFGKLADRIDKRLEIIIGIFALGFAIGIIGFFSSLASLLILGIIFGLGLSFSTIAISTYLSEVARRDEIGASLGGLSSVMDVGNSLGPLVTGIIITYLSFAGGFAASLVIALIALLVFIISNRKCHYA
jgi:MFS family permease